MSEPEIEVSSLVLSGDQKWRYESIAPTAALVERAFAAFGEVWFERVVWGTLCEFTITAIEHGAALREGVAISGYFQPKRRAHAEQ